MFWISDILRGEFRVMDSKNLFFFMNISSLHVNYMVVKFFQKFKAWRAFGLESASIQSEFENEKCK